MDVAEILRIDQRGIAERILNWRYGVIEAQDGQVTRIRGRGLPKFVSRAGVWWGQRFVHRFCPGDRCRLYYDQPLFHSRFLAVKYLQSHSQCSLATISATLKALDHIAELKRIDAIVAEVKNRRLTPRVMRRFGFEQHLQHRSQQHYIRRFYGEYPQA